APNGGELLTGEATYEILWSATSEIGVRSDGITLKYSSNSGSSWTTIATGEANTGIYTWEVAAISSTECRISVEAEDTDGNKGYDVSDLDFTISTEVVVVPVPLVTVEAPNGGELLTAEATYEILWSATSDTGIGSDGITLKYSSNSGSSWTTIATGEANTGIYTWEVAAISSTECRISVEAEDLDGNKGYDVSDLDFTIEVIVPPLVTVEAPNGGETLTGEAEYEIRWSATSDMGIRSDGITLKYSVNSGGSWESIASGEANTGIYTWEAPAISSTECRISVEAEDTDGNKGYDVSDSNFTISPEASPPVIGRIKMNGIHFTSGNIVSANAEIQLSLTDSQGVATIELYVDGVLTPTAFTLDPSGTTFEGTWRGKLAIEDVGTHTLTFRVIDGIGNVSPSTDSYTTTIRVMGGAVQVVGRVMNYPNPFRPASGGTTNIQYTLSTDATITLIIYDITGHEVKRMKFSSGSSGGRGGINQITWSGETLGGDIAGDGMYLYKIISGDKVLGSGKLVIFD
ncbi:MAG: T9SS type A sorting domain-containing protein, partial [bacterium]